METNMEIRDRRKTEWSPSRLRKYPSRKMSEIVKKTNGQCFYCGGVADSVEHIVPKRYGGTDDLGNLVLSCRSCNSRKALNSIWEFGIILTALEIFGLRTIRRENGALIIEFPLGNKVSDKLLNFLENPQPIEKYNFGKKLKELWKK